jgi:hypothetical protein
MTNKDFYNQYVDPCLAVNLCNLIAFLTVLLITLRKLSSNLDPSAKVTVTLYTFVIFLRTL